MIIAVWIPLLMPLLAVPAARRLAESLPPRAAAWLLTGCAAALAGCTTAALGLLLAAGVLRLPPVAALGHLSLPLLGDSGDGAVTVPVAAAAAGLLGACALAVARHARRHRAELRTARHATGAHPASGDLVVLPDPTPEAYALPGRPGRVVVTAGMLRTLPAAEREALFAHERAHLAGRHHLFLLTVTLSAACHPLLRSLRAPWRTPWSAGPTKPPRPGWATAGSRPGPSDAPRWPPARMPGRRTVPAVCSPRRPARCRAGSPPCWPTSGRRVTPGYGPASGAAG